MRRLRKVLGSVESGQHLAVGARIGTTGPQRTGVGMRGLRQLAGGHFIDLRALIHHQHPVAMLRHQRQIVT
ncbi:Uncharacterised protein [Raoultella planticola]|nr:Uncharacterised protein [Raoultella planticola]